MGLRAALDREPNLDIEITRARWHQDTVQSVAEIERVVAAVTGGMVAAEYPGRDAFAMRLALEEALVNAVKHGNGNDPAKSVRVSYRVTAQRVLTEVEDEGPGFDPGEVPDPTAPENLERSSGRGLFLMRSYMTWIRYNERGNRVALCKERSAS
jgi:serine/threonine-protein kinase RsbW